MSTTEFANMTINSLTLYMYLVIEKIYTFESKFVHICSPGNTNMLISRVMAQAGLSAFWKSIYFMNLPGSINDKVLISEARIKQLRFRL